MSVSETLIRRTVQLTVEDGVNTSDSTKTPLTDAGGGE